MTIPSDSILVESKTARDSQIATVSDDRATEVLNKVKALIFFTHKKTGVATTEQLAAFYAVGKEAVQKVVQRNRAELESDGFRTIRGAALKSLRNKLDSHVVDKMSISEKTLESLLGLGSDNTSRPTPDKVVDTLSIPKSAPVLNIWTPRAALRLGMLLQDSEVAKQVRTVLLNMVESDTRILASTTNPIALPPNLDNLIRETNRLYGEFEVLYIEPTPALEIGKEIGDRLLQLKAQVGHGNWERFREENIHSPHTGQPMPSSTATMYQRIAKGWEILQQMGVSSIRDALYVLRRDRGDMSRLVESEPRSYTPKTRLQLIREAAELGEQLGGFDEYQAKAIKHLIIETLIGEV